MRLLTQTLLYLSLLAGAGNCYCGTSFDTSLRQMEEQNRRTELELKRAQLQTMQMQAQSDQLTAQLLADIAAKKTEQAAAEQREQARKLAEKAAQDAQAAQEQLALSAVRTRTDFYLFGLVATLVGFAFFVNKIKRRGTPMTEHEKVGLTTIIVSFLCAAFFLMISSDWVYTLDFINNVMVTLRVQFLASEPDQYGTIRYSIDVPTKYVIFACLMATAYGVTTYIGITPVPKRKATRQET